MAGVVAAGVFAPRAAEACGGCFIAGGETESTVVTSHRMAMAISPTQSVLWDQIQYAGNPEEFSWVLPVKPGATLELAEDAFFDVLEAATQGAVTGPSVQCSSGGNGGTGFGCSSSDAASDGGGLEGAPPPPVTVVSQATVGPYETVTLSTEQPGALNAWLDSHGYAVPEDIQPVVDDYVAEGFDFIALRLIPGANVQQMQPVRVLMPGGQLTLPLRLVAAGTGARTALTLFVIGEGRYAAQNFPNAVLPHERLLWNYNDRSSNYSEVRLEALAENEGRTWLTSYARSGAFFEQVRDGASEWGDVLRYNADSGTGAPGARTIAEAYFQATDRFGCADGYLKAARRGDRVVDNCVDGVCEPVALGEVGHDALDCGAEAPNDLLAATTGMRLSDVWLTRLDADLPRAALSDDLVLEPSSQEIVEHRFIASLTAGSPCGPSASPAGVAMAVRKIPGGFAGLLLGALGAMLVLRRRPNELS